MQIDKCSHTTFILYPERLISTNMVFLFSSIKKCNKTHLQLSTFTSMSRTRGNIFSQKAPNKVKTRFLFPHFSIFNNFTFHLKQILSQGLGKPVLGRVKCHRSVQHSSLAYESHEIVFTIPALVYKFTRHTWQKGPRKKARPQVNSVAKIIPLKMNVVQTKTKKVNLPKTIVPLS